MERWVREAGVDGFNVKEVVRTGTLDDFVDLVVPELRERGLLPAETETGTLRDQLFDDGPQLPPTHPGSDG